LAINSFVLAYNLDAHMLLEYWPRRHMDQIRLARCDENWQMQSGRDFPTWERALEVADRFFNAARRDWVLVEREIEAWHAPAAKTFEERRLRLLRTLRVKLPVIGN
jgi:hypothetical protein